MELTDELTGLQQLMVYRHGVWGKWLRKQQNLHKTMGRQIKHINYRQKRDPSPRELSALMEMVEGIRAQLRLVKVPKKVAYKMC